MPSVTVFGLPEGAVAFDADVISQLEWADVSADQDRHHLEVSVETVDDCNRVAEALVAWIARTKTEFRLATEGPGGESELRMLRVDHVGFYLSDMIAIAALIK